MVNKVVCKITNRIQLTIYNTAPDPTGEQQQCKCSLLQGEGEGREAIGKVTEKRGVKGRRAKEKGKREK